MLDVIIIGAGPIGLACGIAAKKEGLRYLIIEKGMLVNSIYNYPLNMTFFSTADRLEIGDIPFISHNPKPTRAEALEYYRRVAHAWALDLELYTPITSIKKTQEHIEVETKEAKYTAKNIILATGFYDRPYLLNVPGGIAQSHPLLQRTAPVLWHGFGGRWSGQLGRRCCAGNLPQRSEKCDLGGQRK